MGTRTGGIVLLIVTLILAILLSVGANFLLHEKAEKQEDEKKEAAFEAVFPDAVSFGEAVYNDDFLKRYLDDSGFSEDRVVVNKVSLARDEHQSAKGIVATVSAYKKYGGIISMLVGIRNDGTVNGYSVLGISEAKGMDTRVEDDEFRDQFAGKKAEQFTLVQEEAQQPDEIVAAGGAEDASQAVVLGVNAAVCSVSFIDEVYGGLLNE